MNSICKKIAKSDEIGQFCNFFQVEVPINQQQSTSDMKDLYDKLLVTETLKFSYHKAVYYFSRQAKTRRNTNIAKISYFSSFLNL